MAERSGPLDTDELQQRFDEMTGSRQPFAGTTKAQVEAHVLDQLALFEKQPDKDAEDIERLVKKAS